VVAKEIGATLIPEPFEDNAYFHRYAASDALLAQTYFQINLGNAHMSASYGGLSVLDSTLHDTHHVWNRWLHEHGYLSNESYDILSALYRRQCARLHAPDLIIYLRPQYNTVLERIRDRGRSYERSISIDDLIEMDTYRQDFWESHPGVIGYDNTRDPAPGKQIPGAIAGRVRRAIEDAHLGSG
jgi:deoxyadenosine/deoxycytidine kinase